MKCPLCKGSGEHRDIDNPREKAEIARYLVSIGLPYREIAHVLGWKSKNSVTHALKTNEETKENLTHKQ